MGGVFIRITRYVNGNKTEIGVLSNMTLSNAVLDQTVKDVNVRINKKRSRKNFDNSTGIESGGVKG